MYTDKKIFYFLAYILIASLLFIIFYSLLHKQTISTQLINKCSVSKNKQEAVTIDVEEKINGLKLIKVPFYTFYFPFPEWEIGRQLTNQFVEEIRFPHTLASLHMAYPSGAHPLFLQKDTAVSVSIIIAPYYCVSVDEWFSKTPYSNKYKKKFVTHKGIRWLIAKRDDSLPLQTIAMMHKHGFHYEFNILMRDKRSADTYKDLMDKMLSTFEEITQSTK